GPHGQMNEAPHLLHLFLLDEVEGVKVLDLSGDLAGVAGGIKVSDFAHSAFAFNNAFPDLGAGIANAADQAQTSNNNTSGQSLPAFRVLVNVIGSVFHGADLFRILVRNFDVKGFFKSHAQLDRIERVRAKIIDEGGIRGDFALVHSKLFNNDLFDFVFHCCHRIVSPSLTVS